MRKIIILIFMLLILSLPAYADYHYASHEGTSEYPYTSWATAADSIQLAVDAASPHDTVYIGAGEYRQQVRVDVDSIALIGMGVDSTMIWWDLYASAIILVYSSFIYMSDFHLQHEAHYTSSVYISFYTCATIERCYFETCGIFAGNKTALIRNCIFNGPEASILTDLWAGNYLEVSNCILNTMDDRAIYSGADTNIIINNIIRTNEDDGIEIQNYFVQPDHFIANNLIKVEGNAMDGIMIEPWQDGLIIINNTIDTLRNGNFPPRVAIYVYSENHNVGIANNSLTGGVDGVVRFWGANSTLQASYNNFWGSPVDFVIDSTNTIDSTFGIFHEYPMYFSGSDYHLQAYSPLIDAGDPNILDIDLSRSDIGCYGGPGGETYIYRDLAPRIPDSLNAEIDFENSLIYLSWRFNREADFNHYLLYRDTVSGFEPGVFNLVAEPDTSYYVDGDFPDGANYYYKIAAIDNQDNLSNYSDELAVILTSIWDRPGVEIPLMTGIINNYPNPFNSNTTIAYRVANIGPIPAKINIDIYDIMGHKVRSLLNERKEVGEHSVVWDGRDDEGRDCATGVYFARITQWDEPRLSSKRKLLLLR